MLALPPAARVLTGPGAIKEAVGDGPGVLVNPG